MAPLCPSQIGLTPACRGVKDGYKTALEELFEELFGQTHCGAMDLGENQTAFNRLVLSSNLRRPIPIAALILGQIPGLACSLNRLLSPANRDR